MAANRQQIARAVLVLMSSSLSETDKATIALFLTAPLMETRAFEAMMAGIIDSKAERESHERMKSELRLLFAGLDRLDMISEDDWNNAG